MQQGKRFKHSRESRFTWDPRIVHGADCTGEPPLRLYYVYGTGGAGQEETWTPVKEIYTEVRVPGLQKNPGVSKEKPHG